MLKIFVSLIFVANFLFAVEEKNVEKETQTTINFVLETIKNKEKNSKEIIFNKIEKLFDFKLMSKISVGKKWNDFSQEEQKIYETTFIEKLKNSLFSKLELYSDEEVEYLLLEKQKENRMIYKTNVIQKNKKEKIEIIYKFYKSETNEWLIYDMDILGVSIIQTYRTQLSEILQKNGSFEDLIKKLKEKEEIK